MSAPIGSYPTWSTGCTTHPDVGRSAATRGDRPSAHQHPHGAAGRRTHGEPGLNQRSPDGTAVDHDLATGDTLAITIAGQPVDLEVTGIYRQLHLGLYLHADTLANLDPQAQPSEYHLLLDDGTDPDAVAAALADASAGLVHAEQAKSFIGPILDTLPGIMLALVAVLAGIAMLGVLNTVWMGVQERTRELGLLKAVGMSNGQVIGSLLLAAAVMAVGGYAIGMPAGVAFTNLLLGGLGRSLGFGPIPAHAATGPLAVILPALLLVAVLGALVPARRAARLAVAEALRAE